MATPESKVKRRIKEALDAYGCYYAMPMGTGYGNSGVPDFLICIRGRFVAIEAKTVGNEPTALQNKHLQDIINAGGTALVINENNVGILTQLLEIRR